MEKVLSWVVENYELLILVGACIFDIVLFLIGVLKKKVDPSLTNVISRLPSMISHAEVVYGNGHGQEKKDCVVSCALSLYKSLTGVEIKEDSSVYRFICDAIETILSTPQKKGK